MTCNLSNNDIPCSTFQIVKEFKPHTQCSHQLLLIKINPQIYWHKGTIILLCSWILQVGNSEKKPQWTQLVSAPQFLGAQLRKLMVHKLTSDWMSTEYLKMTSSCDWVPHNEEANFPKQVSKRSQMEILYFMTWPWKWHCITFAIPYPEREQRLYFSRGGVSKAHCKKIRGERRHFPGIFGKYNWSPH